jgi:hypothetical protein
MNDVAAAWGSDVKMGETLGFSLMTATENGKPVGRDRLGTLS